MENIEKKDELAKKMAKDMKDEFDKHLRQMKLSKCIGYTIRYGRVVYFILLGIFGICCCEIIRTGIKARVERDKLEKQYVVTNMELLDAYMRWFSTVSKSDLQFNFYIVKSVYNKPFLRLFPGLPYTPIVYSFDTDKFKNEINIVVQYLKDLTCIDCSLVTNIASKDLLKKCYFPEYQDAYEKFISRRNVKKENMDTMFIPLKPPKYIQKHFAKYHYSLLYMANIAVQFLTKINKEEEKKLWKKLYNKVIDIEDEKWLKVKPEYKKIEEQISTNMKWSIWMIFIGLLFPVIYIVAYRMHRWGNKVAFDANKVKQELLEKYENLPDKIIAALEKQERKELKELRKKEKNLLAEKKSEELERQKKQKEHIEEYLNKAFNDKNIVTIFIESIAQLNANERKSIVKTIFALIPVRHIDNEKLKLYYDADVSIARGEVVEALERRSHQSQLDELQQLFSKIDDTEQIDEFAKRLKALKNKLE